MNRSDPNGEDWQDIAKVGLAVAAIGLFTLSVVSTGGGALLLAGAGISASAATTAASATAAAGLATTGISILQATNDKGYSEPHNYQKARNNKEANKWAEQVGEKSAESLKESFVGKKNISKFNMLKNKDTGEIVLEAIKTKVKIFTELFLR